MNTHWRLYGEHTVAALLDRQQLPGWLFGIAKKAVIGPNEAAVVIRDGKPQDVVTETSVLTAGVVDRLRQAVGVAVDVQVYFVDLSPFELTLFLGRQEMVESESSKFGISRQKHRTSGSATLGSTDGGSGESISSARSDTGDRLGGQVRARAKTNFERLQDGYQSSRVSNHTLRGTAELTVQALSADGEVVQAACQFRMRVDGGNLAGLSGLLRGRQGVATWDVAALVRDEVLARVVVPLVARHPASDLRANRPLTEAVEAGVREVAAARFRPFGLLLDSFSVSWGTTEAEGLAIASRRGELGEAWEQFQNQRRLAELSRGHAIDMARLTNLKDFKAAKIAGQDDLRTQHLAATLGWKVQGKGNELALKQLDAQIQEVQLRVDKSKATFDLERRRAEAELDLEVQDRHFKQQQARRLAEIEADDRELGSMVRAKVELATAKHEQEMARRRQEIDAEHRRTQADVEDRYQQRKVKLEESLARMGMIERLVSQGLAGGQADAGVLTTLLTQATEQEYATTTDERVRARSQALAAGAQVDTYRTAQADERGHQATLTRLSADLMGAAKQPPAPVIMPGASVIPVPVATPVAPHPPAAAPCPGCRQPTQAGWRACPFCGGQLVPTPRCCSGCRAELQPGWKVCPACGTPPAN